MAFIPDAPPAAAPRASHFVPDAPPKDDTTPNKKPEPTALEEAGTGALGAGELLSGLVSNLPHAAAHAAVDIYRRLTGGDTGAPDPSLVQHLQVPLGQAGQKVAADFGPSLSSSGTPGALAQPDIETAALHREQASQPGNATALDIGNQIRGVAGDVGALAPAVGGLRTLIGLPGEIAASRAAAAAARTPAETNLGMVTGADSPLARNLAGNSAQPTVTAHNQGIADQQLTAQVGAKSPKVTDLEEAKAPANAVYSRVEQALPTAPLSPAAQQMVQGVGADDMVVHSPNTQAVIDAQKARLLAGPVTGSEAVNTQRALRYNGFKNQALDDPENQALGAAQLKLSDALHQHMVDTLPPNADVTMEQLTQARQALAQINTLQNAAKGSNINLQALARVHRDNPGLLTGPMRDVAEFADQHPEVSSLPSNSERFNPSDSITHDLTSIDLKKPASYLQPLVGAAARRSLVGGAPAAPTSGLADALAPIDRTPQPPPGMTASTPSASPPAAPASPGQISLADVLSHGVERGPSPGLSLASGQPAAPHQGIPFKPNLEHAAGGLSLADELHPNVSASNADLPGVMSQGVPEGTMTRTPSRPQGAQPTIDFPSGAQSVSRAANNASGESAASQEAVNRTAEENASGRTRFLIDPDGNVTPIKGVESADRRAPQGSVIVQKGIGSTPYTIIDRGGLPLSHANGLINRAFGRGLSDEF